MLIANGEQKLREFSETAYPREIIKINDRIHHVIGYGHSNCIVIEGDSSLILVDTMDSDARAEKLKKELKERTDKPVKTIIYTHGHPDHRGGAAAFKDTVEEIIASSPRKPMLKYMDRIAQVLNQRTVRQFGYKLTDEETITQGIGIREGHAVGEGRFNVLPPTTIFEEKMEERVIDGVKLCLVSAIGETDDQIFVWLPDDEVLCSGDNYYGCWPNLYAIRGSQYRDVAAWVDSLAKILSYPAKALLPGHTKPIIGYEKIQEVVGNYKDAIESILLQTIDCINRGLGEEETAAAVSLPEHLKEKPYLQEFYGTVNWSVRSIYNGYLGWFDGNPTHLNKLSFDIHAKKTIAMMGGEEKVAGEAGRALEEGEYQWALELCDLLLDAGVKEEEAKELKARGLLELAKLETSANGRHYYIASAKELLGRD